MAVSRAEKTTELDALTSAFGQSQSAILLDFRGIKVPEVTELRRQVRAAKGAYKVVKNTLAKRALKGTRVRGVDRRTSKGPRRSPTARPIRSASPRR